MIENGTELKIYSLTYEDLQEQIKYGPGLERYTLSNESILDETNEEVSNENKTNIKKQRK